MDHRHDLRLVDHLEAFLGGIQRGWSKLPDGSKPGFQVLEFEGSATLEGVVAYSTLGLSNCPMPPPAGSGQLIRQELMIMARREFGAGNIPGVLQQVAQEAVDRNRAYLCGEVIGPRGNLFEGASLEALYVAIPVYLPDEFASCRLSTGEVAIIGCLVPITRAESEYVFEFGSEKFEDLLSEVDPYLLGVHRSSMV